MALNTTMFTPGDLAAASAATLRGQEEAQHSTQSSMGRLGEKIVRVLTSLVSPIRSAIEILFGSVDKPVVVTDKMSFKAFFADLLGNEVLSKQERPAEIKVILSGKLPPREKIKAIYHIMGISEKKIDAKLKSKTNAEVLLHLTLLGTTLKQYNASGMRLGTHIYHPDSSCARLAAKTRKVNDYLAGSPGVMSGTGRPLSARSAG